MKTPESPTMIRNVNKGLWKAFVAEAGDRGMTAGQAVNLILEMILENDFSVNGGPAYVASFDETGIKIKTV